jgi:peptidyl-prolyl cis-trans isomerase D
MAMLISKFHRLIQSRLLWGIILIVIIFSFVIWGMQWPSQSTQAAEASAAGKLNGKLVSQEEFRNAYFNVFMSVQLMMGRPINVNERIDAELRSSAWGRLIALREANKLGITASDQEVMMAIQNNPGFTAEGRFNQAQYTAFIQNILAPMGFSEPQFEEHVREEIVLQKLRHIVQQNVMVSPTELKRTYDILTDIFNVEYVTMTTNDVAKDVKVTAEDAHKLYLADPKAFEIPEQVTVKYVEFPVDNFLAKAEVTEEEALDYYNEHLDEYMTTNAPAATADTNAQDSLTIPFEQVKTNITNILKQDVARSKASEAATDFVVALAPDRDGKQIPFDDLAAKHELAVKKAGPFGLYDEVPGIDPVSEFNVAAFRLTKLPEEYFSDAIPGSNVVYVLALEDKVAPRIPEFKEVEKEAMERARMNAMNEALSKKAQDVREAAVKTVADGKTFAQAVKPFDLKVEQIEDFSVTSGMKETNELSSVIVRGVISKSQGELSDLISAPDAVVLAYVAKRTPSETVSFSAMRPQIAESIKRQRGQTLFEEWKSSLLKAAGFEDRMAQRAAAEEAVEEDMSSEEDQQPRENTSQYQ